MNINTKFSITTTSITTTSILIMGLIASTLQGCAINLTNDTTNPLLIKLNGTKTPQEIVIHQNETVTFGDNTKHANFNVYTQSKPGAYNYKYTLKQYACSMGKSIDLKATDIPNKVDTGLFKISSTP